METKIPSIVKVDLNTEKKLPFGPIYGHWFIFKKPNTDNEYIFYSPWWPEIGFGLDFINMFIKEGAKIVSHDPLNVEFIKAMFPKNNPLSKKICVLV